MTQGRQPRIPLSVIILTCGRPRELERVLESVTREGARRGWECLVIGNGEEPPLPPDPQIRLIRSPRLNPGAARNAGIREAQGEWILFLDDDAWLPEGAGQAIERILARAGAADIIGGPNLTPPGSSRFQVWVGQALASRVGAWFSRSRYRPMPDRRGLCGEESVMLCNLLVKRAFLRRTRIVFRAELVCNEENALIRESLEQGARVIYEPDFYVWHERRPTVGSLLRQVRKYGRGRLQQSRVDPGSLRPGHLAPVVFAIYALVLPALLTGGAAWLIPAALYGLLILLASVRARSVGTGFVFPLIHFSYAFGFLQELIVHAFPVSSVSARSHRVGPIRFRA